ncbi:MAG: exodeoxyribonuclease VII large subunit, partial [Clostridia bacterium]|nr:exodeoxyribonuclease VII large subunit [Clostridia bacterium]
YSFVDTVIIGRGGGASDDLFPFNDELLARKIYEFEIPIISAVGHEIDFTISDFVADMRAETPTAAAQLAVPDINEIKFILDKNKLSMETSLYRLIEIEKTKIQNAKFKMDNSIANIINTFKNALDKNKLLLEENNPLQIMKKGYAVLEDEDNKLVSSLKAIDLSKDYNLRLQDGTLKIKILDKREEPCQKN